MITNFNLSKIQLGGDANTAIGSVLEYKVDTNPPEIHSDIYFDASSFDFEGQEESFSITQFLVEIA